MENNNRKKNHKIDLLSNPRLIGKWLPKFLSNPNSWKIFSGKWGIGVQKQLVCLGESNIITGENISLNGFGNWVNYTLQIRFKILTESSKPPEGGVIFYYHFRNFKNYYSLHFCHAKGKVELIKRVRGIWSTIVERKFDFEFDKDYEMTLSIISDSHLCQINGEICLEIQDSDVPKGCMGIGTKYCACEFSGVSVSLQ